MSKGPEIIRFQETIEAGGPKLIHEEPTPYTYGMGDSRWFLDLKHVLIYDVIESDGKEIVRVELRIVEGRTVCKTPVGLANECGIVKVEFLQDNITEVINFRGTSLPDRLNSVMHLQQKTNLIQELDNIASDIALKWLQKIHAENRIVRGIPIEEAKGVYYE